RSRRRRGGRRHLSWRKEANAGDHIIETGQHFLIESAFVSGDREAVYPIVLNEQDGPLVYRNSIPVLELRIKSVRKDSRDHRMRLGNALQSGKRGAITLYVMGHIVRPRGFGRRELVDGQYDMGISTSDDAPMINGGQSRAGQLIVAGTHPSDGRLKCDAVI